MFTRTLMVFSHTNTKVLKIKFTYSYNRYNLAKNKFLFQSRQLLLENTMKGGRNNSFNHSSPQLFKLFCVENQQRGGLVINVDQA